MTYMTNKKRLKQHQSGNKKLYCKTLNVMITDKAMETMDAKKVILVVFFDLSKALDSIDCTTLP